VQIVNGQAERAAQFIKDGTLGFEAASAIQLDYGHGFRFLKPGNMLNDPLSEISQGGGGLFGGKFGSAIPRRSVETPHG
jgi:hypothetical protein